MHIHCLFAVLVELEEQGEAVLVDARLVVLRNGMNGLRPVTFLLCLFAGEVRQVRDDQVVQQEWAAPRVRHLRREECGRDGCGGGEPPVHQGRPGRSASEWWPSTNLLMARFTLLLLIMPSYCGVGVVTF